VVDGGLVVPLDVGQAVDVEPALAGEAIALELDGNVVLQLVAQGEDEGFDGGFGLGFIVVPRSDEPQYSVQNIRDIH
jgi:hypothetical protein